MLAAVASLLRGGRYIHPATSDQRPAASAPLAPDAALPVGVAPRAADRSSGEGTG